MPFDLPFSVWSEDELNELKTSVEKLTEDRTQKELLEEWGITKKALPPALQTIQNDSLESPQTPNENPKKRQK